MRILILSQWFDPEPTFKGLAFAQALAARGHQVEVITGFPNYPGGRVYPGYRVRLRQCDCMSGVPVTRVALYPSHDNSATRRAANYLTFAGAASTVGVLSVPRPDVVYAYHPPATIAFPALVLRTLRRVPFVLDIQDLWPDTLSATGMVANRALLSAVAAFCRIAYRAASRISVLSRGFKYALVERGVPSEKIEVIHNWCDEGAVTRGERCAPILEEAGIENRFNVVFAGNMGRAQALSSVLRAAGIVAERTPRVQFIFVGGGIEVEALKAEAARMSLPNVRFLSARPAAEVGPLLAAADLLLVHLRDDPLFSITIPSKTQAYMAAGRPILMAVRGDAAAMVEEAGSGVCVNPMDPEALSDAVCELSSVGAAPLVEMGDRGRTYYLKHLALDVGVTRFEALFRKAVSGS